MLLDMSGMAAFIYAAMNGSDGVEDLLVVDEIVNAF